MEHINPPQEPEISVEHLKRIANGVVDSDALDIKKNGPSRMAEGIALHRCAETMLPEDLRLFSDPYAVHFLNPATVTWARDHPAEVKALAEKIEQKMPGGDNAIRGRIRYFDDVVKNAADEGFSQLVFVGAGYDTRAYRIDTLKGNIRVFEIDRPETIERKTGILKKIFGQVPCHVAFIPLDMERDECWDQLAEAGWSCDTKALFILEGFVMYLALPVVRSLLSGIASQSAAGSAVLFDFFPRLLSDGSSDAESMQYIRDWTSRIGEPILSEFAEGEVEPFLADIGYSGITVVSSRAFAQMYFTGKRADRKVSGLMSLAYATVADKGRDHP